MGPKAAGKSRVAGVLSDCCAVHHVDPDQVVLALIARDVKPDRDSGWLRYVEEALDRALAVHDRISTEATGAWDSDWQLIEDLRGRGLRVLTVWVEASLTTSLARLGERQEQKVPTTTEEAVWYFQQASHKAQAASFDLVVDGDGDLSDETVVAQLRSLFTT